MKEKVCEKNCSDYLGMEELHKEQCDCSCHKETSEVPSWEEEIKEYEIVGYHESVKDFISQTIISERKSAVETYKNIPMGASNWVNHGIKWGYEDFFYGKEMKKVRKQAITNFMVELEKLKDSPNNLSLIDSGCKYALDWEDVEQNAKKFIN